MQVSLLNNVSTLHCWRGSYNNAPTAQCKSGFSLSYRVLPLDAESVLWMCGLRYFSHLCVTRLKCLRYQIVSAQPNTLHNYVTLLSKRNLLASKSLSLLLSVFLSISLFSFALLFDWSIERSL